LAVSSNARRRIPDRHEYATADNGCLNLADPGRQAPPSLPPTSTSAW
jgi:hypothetical protein